MQFMQKTAFRSGDRAGLHGYGLHGKSTFTKILLVMKLTVVLLAVACLQVSAKGLAQSVTFSGKNVPLKTVFESIRKQTGYVFFSDKGLFDKAHKVTVNVKDVSLKIFLDSILSDQPFTYTLSSKTILLSEKKKIQFTPAMLNALDATFQPVTGEVHNAKGERLPGVTVTIKGSGKAVSSDENGRFMIDAQVGAVLVFTSVGFEAQEVKVKSGTVDVLLKEAVRALDETVVIGYGSTRRRDLTGSIASVNVEEVKNAPFTSIDQALAGKAPGVQVTQADGSPGGVAKIRIRGGTSLIGGNDPLYIIDGVQVQIQNRYVQAAADITNPVEKLGNDTYSATAVGSSFSRGLNTLAGLNINDIESIDILKDASATAIYGSRAANGVVIITTKKGKKNEKPVLEANFYSALSSAITQKVLNAGQYKAVLKEGAANLNAIKASQGLPANATATSILTNPAFFGQANTNWLHVVTRTGVTENADISVRGGGSGSRYYTSLSYNRQTGALKGTDFKRIAGKINLDNEISNRLRLITNLDYSFTANNITNGIYSSALFAAPTDKAYNADGTPLVFVPSGIGSSVAAGIQNPLSLLQGKNYGKTAMLLGSASVEYDMLSSLKFRSTFSVNYSNYKQENYVPGTVSIAGNTSSSQGGIATQAHTDQTDVFYENTLTWDKQFNGNNRINVLAGTSWQKSQANTFSASGQGFPDDQFMNGLSSAAVALPPRQSNTQSSLLSFYLRANYALRERYLFTVTGRSDASSKFAKGNRVGYFPSFGVAWRITEERFMKSVTWVNELKLRTSAGYTGTQNIGDNLFYTLYTPASYAGTNAMIPTQLGNDKIKWESTLQKDAGIDFALFASRLRGSFGYYEKKSTGLLMAYSVASSSGFANALMNFADINNKGLEIDLRGDVIRNKNFQWNIAMNMSGNRSKVLHIHNDLQNPRSVTPNADPFVTGNTFGNTILREGQPVGLIFTYKYQGVIRTKEQLDAYKTKLFYAKIGSLPNLGIGDAQYKLVESGAYAGFPVREVTGKAQPEFYGGVTQTLSYKNFSVLFLLTYSYGGDLLYLPDGRIGLGDRANQSTRILDHYSDANPNSSRPRLVLGENNTPGVTVSDLAVHDASYIKLKSISLSYQVPQALLSKLHMRTASVYVSGNNLLIISGYPGPDPEVSNDPYSLINGYSDAATYPSMRQYNAGIRIGF